MHRRDDPCHGSRKRDGSPEPAVPQGPFGREVMKDNLKRDEHNPGQPSEIKGWEGKRMKDAGQYDGKKRRQFIEVRGG